MCKLVLKICKTGRKNHLFTKIVVLQNKTSVNFFHDKLGFYDNRKRNPKIFLSKVDAIFPRNIIFNVRKFLYYYYLKGAVPKKKALSFIYYYFLARGALSSNYFEIDQIKLFLFYEIKKKKLF